MENVKLDKLDFYRMVKAAGNRIEESKLNINRAYVAIDSNGATYLHENKPCILVKDWHNSGAMLYLGYSTYCDWKGSLVKLSDVVPEGIPKSEPSLENLISVIREAKLVIKEYYQYSDSAEMNTYIAIDSDGEAYVYQEKPYIIGDNEDWSSKCDLIYIGRYNLTCDWKDTLIKLSDILVK